MLTIIDLASENYANFQIKSADNTPRELLAGQDKISESNLKSLRAFKTLIFTLQNITEIEKKEDDEMLNFVFKQNLQTDSQISLILYTNSKTPKSQYQFAIKFSKNVSLFLQNRKPHEKSEKSLTKVHSNILSELKNEEVSELKISNKSNDASLIFSSENEEEFFKEICKKNITKIDLLQNSPEKAQENQINKKSGKMLINESFCFVENIMKHLNYKFTHVFFYDILIA